MKLFKQYKTLNELLPDFLQEKELSLHYKTFIGYRGKLKIFKSWLENNGYSTLPLKNITEEIISDFFVYLIKERNLDKPTCEKYFLNIRSLFQYAKKRHEVDKFPFDLIVYPIKKKDMSAEIIPIDHLKIILEYMKIKDPQLYLAAMLEYYCFLRPGKELRLLKVGDIDLDNGTIQITTDHAKNGHKRVVTMPCQLIEICKEYGIDTADKSLYVIGKHKKIEAKPISENMLRYRFNKIRSMFNLPIGYKFYSFKHTGATILHNSNIVSLRELMDQLGHSKLEATQHYVKKHGGFINNNIRNGFPSPM